MITIVARGHPPQLELSEDNLQFTGRTTPLLVSPNEEEKSKETPKLRPAVSTMGEGLDTSNDEPPKVVEDVQLEMDDKEASLQLTNKSDEPRKYDEYSSLLSPSPNGNVFFNTHKLLGIGCATIVCSSQYGWKSMSCMS